MVLAAKNLGALYFVRQRRKEEGGSPFWGRGAFCLLIREANILLLPRLRPFC